MMIIIAWRHVLSALLATTFCRHKIEYQSVDEEMRRLETEDWRLEQAAWLLRLLL